MDGLIASGNLGEMSVPWKFEFGYCSDISNVQVAGPYSIVVIGVSDGGG